MQGFLNTLSPRDKKKPVEEKKPSWSKSLERKRASEVCYRMVSFDWCRDVLLITFPQMVSVDGAKAKEAQRSGNPCPSTADRFVRRHQQYSEGTGWRRIRLGCALFCLFG